VQSTPEIDTRDASRAPASRSSTTRGDVSSLSPTCRSGVRALELAQPSPRQLVLGVLVATPPAGLLADKEGSGDASLPAAWADQDESSTNLFGSSGARERTA